MSKIDLNYSRVETAISFIRQHFKSQPSLDDVAQAVGVSSSHLQRIFTDWAGVSPKKFVQYLSLEYAKSTLIKNQSSLLDAAYQSGLSGGGRLYDLFVNIEGMTPGEFKNAAKSLSINYSFSDTPFGQVIVAATCKGVCYMAFEERKERAFDQLREKFPKADFNYSLDCFQNMALTIFKKDWSDMQAIKLHLKGTDFQLKVWNALLNIPFAQLSSYGAVAQKLNNPAASRAVGTAIGNNPVAVLIPCHRVIRATGDVGGYMWGDNRKAAIIAWEAAQNSESGAFIE